MRDLSEAVRIDLRAALHATAMSSLALPFVEAVVLQRAYPLGDSMASGASASERDVAERRVADQVIRLVVASLAEERSTARAGEELAADPALLAAFFQNLDLLPADGGSPLDGLVRLAGAALQRLTDTLTGEERRGDAEA